MEMDNENLNNGHFINNFDEEDRFDVKRYLVLFASNWYWFAISLFLAFSVAYGINRYSEPVYNVSCSMLIKDEQAGGKSGDDIVQGMDIFNSQQNLKNEIGILKSFYLNRKVIDSLPEFNIIYIAVGRRKIVEKKKYLDCPFIVYSDSIDYQPENKIVNIKFVSDKSFTVEIEGHQAKQTEYKFGEKFNEAGFNFRIFLRNPGNFKFDNSESNRYYFYFENKDWLAEVYRSKLNINPIEEEASLVNISISGPAISKETEYLNKLMELYIQDGLDVKNAKANKTIEFIIKQIARISETLKKSEGKLERFRSDNQLVDLTSEGNRIKNRLESYEKERIEYDLTKQYYDYLKEYLVSKDKTGNIISPSLMGVSDQNLIALVQAYSQMQLERKQLESNYTVNLTPIMLLDKKIEITRLTLLENINNSIRKADQELSDVNKRISIVNNDFNKLPAIERELISIQRDFDLNNTIYTYLLEKKSEAEIALASNVSINREIDKARVSSAVAIKPRVRRNYTSALIFGFLLPIVLIMVIDYLNNKIIDRKDIEKGTRVPVLGYIGHNISKDETPVKNNPGSTLAESFRSVRTALKYMKHDSEQPVISITSTISAEGKTFVSVNLAIIYAMLGKKVLLIGLDLRRPRIHKLFNLPNQTGLSMFLGNMAEYRDVITQTSIENLFYVPSGPIPPNPAELIESQRMREFIIQSKKEFDFIIIDTPPVAIVSDALLLAEFADINLFVVRQRYSSRNTLELIDELFRRKKLKNMGVIINDISLSGYYGYGLRYGYASGYGYSYGNNYYGAYKSGRSNYYTDSDS